MIQLINKKRIIRMTKVGMIERLGKRSVAEIGMEILIVGIINEFEN